MKSKYFTLTVVFSLAVVLVSGCAGLGKTLKDAEATSGPETLVPISYVEPAVVTLKVTKITVDPLTGKPEKEPWVLVEFITGPNYKSGFLRIGCDQAEFDEYLRLHHNIDEQFYPVKLLFNNAGHLYCNQVLEDKLVHLQDPGYMGGGGLFTEDLKEITSSEMMYMSVDGTKIMIFSVPAEVTAHPELFTETPTVYTLDAKVYIIPK